MISNEKITLEETACTFLKEMVGDDHTLVKVAGDASFRSYYRVASTRERWIFMDAPPQKEDSAPFVDIARFLAAHGVPVPRIVEARLANGHLLIEDFGDTTFLKAIEAGQEPLKLYEQAVDVLLDIQATPLDGSCIAHQRPYDRALLRRELALFTDWYLQRVVNIRLTAGEREDYEAIFQTIIDRVLEQPRVFVHRDYHSRNLMRRADGGIGVLDFQDGVVGPVTYDLASLLRDCYVAWDAPFRRKICDRWLAGARERLGYDPDPERFRVDFDWMSIQRNLKAVGIFGRLSRRDGKHGYLNDIPRTLGYILENVRRHPGLNPLERLLAHHLPSSVQTR